MSDTDLLNFHICIPSLNTKERLYCISELLFFCFPFQGNNFLLREKIEEYSNSFTIHGLSRTIHTDSHLERIFWVIALIMAVVLAFLMVRSIIVKFWDNDVYINTETKITTKNHFPAVTFCLEPITIKNEYCSMVADDDLPGALPRDMPSCNVDKWWEIPTSTVTNTLAALRLVGQTTLITLPLQTFSFHCAQGNCLNKDISHDYFVPFGDKCVTWNYKGQFYNAKNRVDLQVSIDNRFYIFKSVVAYVHDHRESPLSYEFNIPLSPRQDTLLIFQKSVKKRMQRSPPHNCESKYYNNSRNIFPGRYTVEACLDTYTCIEALKSCGETLDFCKKYLPVELLERYWKANKTFHNTHRCFKEGFDNGIFTGDRNSCLSPCENTQYYTTSIITPGSFKLSMAFKERNVYEFQEEKTVYTWEDFIAGIGGMIGLFCGFSILSLAELLVYIGLKCLSGYGKADEPTDSNKDKSKEEMGFNEAKISYICS